MSPVLRPHPSDSAINRYFAYIKVSTIIARVCHLLLAEINHQRDRTGTVDGEVEIKPIVTATITQEAICVRLLEFEEHSHF